jgi:two-component system cell cycle response regulator
MSGRILIAAGTIEAARPFETVLAPAFDVAIATKAEEALIIARRGGCDLILLDGSVPDSDAAALCRQIKEAAPAVAVLVATAAGEPLQRLRALDAGADECLSWPASASTLLLRTHSIVQAAVLAAQAGRGRALLGLDPGADAPEAARILILDPCDWSRTRLAEIVGSLGHVMAFADLDAGLVAVAEECPDLALVSLDWPDQAGVNLIRQLHMVTSEKEPAVLAVADRDDFTARLCVESGIDDRILRPVDRCEVLLRARLSLKKAKLSAILRAREPEAPLPEPHRLNRSDRRPPPQRYAA